MTTVGGDTVAESGEPGQFGLAPLSRPETVSGEDASTLDSPTHTHVDTLSHRSISPGPNTISRASGKQAATEENTTLGGHEEPAHLHRSGDADPPVDHPRPLVEDEDVDPAPFRFKPFHLASLVDPKSLGDLEGMGGIDGVLNGLGTHRTKGLPWKGGQASSSPHLGNSNGSQGVASPGIIVTSPSGNAADQEVSREQRKTWDGGGAAELASMEERRRVYGMNALPSRKTKSLLALMWTALKDKVLVRHSVMESLFHSHPI
jgi:P-type Ca2+ transporter type 2C